MFLDTVETVKEGVGFTLFGKYIWCGFWLL